MKFSAKEDIEVPIERLFEMLADVEAFERAALRRGAEVQRTDTLRQPGPGMSWKTRFMFRGRERRVAIEMTRLDPPNGMSFKGSSPALEGTMQVELVALSRKRTRMAITTEIAPKTLAARLMVQSLKLARNNVNRRFHLRIAGFAKDLEDRYRRAA